MFQWIGQWLLEYIGILTVVENIPQASNDENYYASNT